MRYAVCTASTGEGMHMSGTWHICIVVEVSLLSCPRKRQLYRTESLHLPGHPVTGAVLRDCFGAHTAGRVTFYSPERVMVSAEVQTFAVFLHSITTSKTPSRQCQTVQPPLSRMLIIYFVRRGRLVEIFWLHDWHMALGSTALIRSCFCSWLCKHSLFTTLPSAAEIAFPFTPRLFPKEFRHLPHFPQDEQKTVVAFS
jgi:hypothetical protein